MLNSANSSDVGNRTALCCSRLHKQAWMWLPDGKHHWRRPTAIWVTVTNPGEQPSPPAWSSTTSRRSFHMHIHYAYDSDGDRVRPCQGRGEPAQARREFCARGADAPGPKRLDAGESRYLGRTPLRHSREGLARANSRHHPRATWRSHSHHFRSQGEQMRGSRICERNVTSAAASEAQ